MHHVGRLAEARGAAGPYEEHSRKHTRIPIVDRSAGSVHQTIELGELGPGGEVGAHVHAAEEGVYVLEGQLVVSVGGTEERLEADDAIYIEAGVAHALANASAGAARWLEIAAPQASPGLGDPALLDGGTTSEGIEMPYRRTRFDERELPPPSDTIGLEGFGAANVGGAALKMVIDRELGASQFNLFVVEYAPGGLIKEHDHPFEEAFFFLTGEIEAVLDGETHVLRAGDYCWSGAASMHAFRNLSDGPTRWIETQVPQPPTRHQARFRGDWDRATRGAEPEA